MALNYDTSEILQKIRATTGHNTLKITCMIEGEPRGFRSVLMSSIDKTCVPCFFVSSWYDSFLLDTLQFHRKLPKGRSPPFSLANIRPNSLPLKMAVMLFGMVRGVTKFLSLAPAARQETLIAGQRPLFGYITTR